MSFVADTSSPVSKRSTSPRPPAVGEEVKRFHDTSQRHPEFYKNWNNMECQSKTSAAEFANCKESGTTAAESAKCFGDSSNPSLPACYRWAESLQCLLEDIQGITLFEKFLKQEGQDMKCLHFWFACRGIKKNNPSNRDEMGKLIKLVFDKQAKRISAISDETKEEIRRKLDSGTDIDDTIFDKAQLEVEEHMMKTTFASFLRSDLYIQHLRGLQGEQSPEKERAVTPEPQDPLPTVHEDSELQIGCNKIPIVKNSVFPRKVSSTSKFKLEGPPGFRSPYSYNNYHSRYGSYLPVSAQDSELQSLSSDAQTDDTMSLTDVSTNADYPMYSSRSKKHQKLPKHSNIILNKERCSHDNFIPRTKRPPVESYKPLPPKEFHAVVVKKLNKLLDERQSREKMTERLKSLESTEHSRSEGIPMPSTQQVPQKTNAPVLESGYLCPPSEENVQDILDQHISRVFEDDSGQHTPGSGCTSPPVARPAVEVLNRVRVPMQASGCESSDHAMAASHKRSQVSQFTVPNSIKIRRDHDTHSIDSAMFDYGSDDNVPSSFRSQPSSAGNSEPLDFNRRWYKDPSKRYPKKSTAHSVDSGISSLNSDSVPSFSNSNRKAIGHSSCRNGSQDAGYSQRPGAPSQLSQDVGLLYLPADTTSNLLEARKRLEDDKAKMKLMKYGMGARNTCDTPRMRFQKGYDSFEDNSSNRKQNRKSLSINLLESANTQCNDVTVIGYSYGRHSVPYLSKYPGKDITLRQFKSVLSKKGDFRYFFKTECDELGTGVVFEEVTDDCKVLPLWEGKVFCVIETVDDSSVL